MKFLFQQTKKRPNWTNSLDNLNKIQQQIIDKCGAY